MSLTFTSTKTHRGRYLVVTAAGALPTGKPWSKTITSGCAQHGFTQAMEAKVFKAMRTLLYADFEKACAAVANTGSAP